ncbi:MAG: hypothetical protein QXM68_01255 [Candidatus Aenigmatarchaeota archaeon]|nr:hypothetical protein [Candidatus Aenigmarchaeota archaeon]
MALNIVTKYKLNTDDFKVYFDNNKKTHIAENIETGEKTNIGVLGIFLEMGILKPLNEESRLEKLETAVKNLSEQIQSLSSKIETLQFNLASSVKHDEEEEEEEQIEEEPEVEEETEKKPKFDIKEKIIEKSIKKMTKYDQDVIKDSDEEEDVWEEI